MTHAFYGKLSNIKLTAYRTYKPTMRTVYGTLSISAVYSFFLLYGY